jgi:uncharacterized membrane protein
MKESPFGFQYSWEDLRPVRPLMVTVIAAQLIGAAAGLWGLKFAEWFLNLWAGGALATFPGFLAGLLVQRAIDEECLSVNRVMVRRLGLVSLVLSLSVLLMPLMGWRWG